MRIIILGSGTGMPLNDRGSPSLVLIMDGEPALFDMGPGSLRQLKRAGINPQDIGHIFLTHFHPDHTVDLISFLFATQSPSILRGRRPFTITGPQGLGAFVRNLQQVYSPWLDLPAHILGIQELGGEDPGEGHCQNFKILWRPTAHTANSLAYGVKDDTGRTVVYSGDTGFSDEMVDLAKGADLLILECSFPDEMPVEGHLTPSQAGRLATQAGVNRLLLTHFYPECLETNIVAQCRKTYEGELILGSDLLHVQV